MTVTKTRAWAAGTAGLAVLVLVATWFLLIGPKRAEAADLAEQRASVEASNAVLAAKTATLKAQFATLDEKRAQLAAIRETLPADTEVPLLLRQLETYAAGADVVLTSITPGSATAFTPGTAEETGGTAVYAVPVSIATAGTFAQTELFLKNVQADMRRFLLVENFSAEYDASAAAAAPTITSTITGQIFVLRTASEQQDTTAAPAATTTTDAGAVS